MALADNRVAPTSGVGHHSLDSDSCDGQSFAHATAAAGVADPPEPCACRGSASLARGKPYAKDENVSGT